MSFGKSDLNPVYAAQNRRRAQDLEFYLTRIEAAAEKALADPKRDAESMQRALTGIRNEARRVRHP